MKLFNMKLFLLTLITLYFFIICDVAALQPSSSTEKMTFFTENYPPANYIEHDKLTGISVDTLKALWTHLNIPEQTILLAPWSRGYHFTLEKVNTVLFSMSRTLSREHLFKWVGPIFNSTHVLIAKKSKKYHFTNTEQFYDHSIAAVQDDISEVSLHQMGFPPANIVKVSQLKQAFLMMDADRVDMMFISLHGFAYLTKKLHIDEAEYEPVWQVNKIGNYFAFNLKTPDSVIQTYQKAFDDIAIKRIAIKQKYDLANDDR